MLQRIFVTGASGFIGQGLVRRLTSGNDRDVRVLTRRPLAGYAARTGEPQRVVGDLLEPGSYRAALAGCDAVVHLAAATGRAAPREYQRVNVEGTEALLRACKAAGVRRFLHVSTIAAGYPNQRFYPYARTKLLAEARVAESTLDYTIIRPTLVLGAMSPIWNTLLKIAKLPVIPLPQGARSVSVQPVHVDDVVRGIELVLEGDAFRNEVLELGGPQPLTFREFLGLVQEAVHGKPGRIVRVPLGPIRLMLAAMEPVVRPLMPVTAGQIAVFANDSVASENWLLTKLRPGMPSVEDMIAALLEAGDGHAGSGAGRTPRKEPHVRPLPDNVKHVLENECRQLTSYLLEANPSAYVTEQYAKAVHAHGLAFDDNFSRFDRATLALARRGRMLARWADAYCAFFCRRGPLRRKLIVLAAILEHVAPTSEAFEPAGSRHAAFAALSIAARGWVSGVSLLMGAVLLVPVDLFCRVTRGRTGQAQ